MGREREKIMTNFRERMHPPVSKAEIEAFKEFSRLGMTKGMVTQEKVCLVWTNPDFLWRDKKKMVFLDGEQVHSGSRLDRDLELEEFIRVAGWELLRFRYKPPMSKAKLAEFVRQVAEFLGFDLEEKKIQYADT